MNSNNKCIEKDSNKNINGDDNYIKNNNNNKDYEDDKSIKNDNNNKDYEYEKIFIFNFFILSTLFFQTKGYECLEILVIYVNILFQMLALMVIRKISLKPLLFILPIILSLLIEYFFVSNKLYNQKGIWINILYYYILFF